MKVYGQLEYMQLEQVVGIGALLGPANVGRMVCDTTAPTAVVPLFYNGSVWQTVLTRTTTVTNASLVDSAFIGNVGLSTAIGSNLLTVTLTQNDGSTAPTTTSPTLICFRDSTLASGDFLRRSITSTLSINTVATGCTFGLVSAQAQYIYVYAIDNAGTVELALAGSRAFDESIRYSTTIINGSSTNSLVLYSTTARTNVAIRLLGRVKVTEATAGTYATAPSEIGLLPLSTNAMIRSEVRVRGNNGFGSTNTKVPRYTTIDKNVGVDIVYADSASVGANFTIITSGLYTMNLCQESASAAVVEAAFLQNPSAGQLIALPHSNAAIARLAFNYVAATLSSANAVVSWTGFLNAGDVIYPNTSAGTPDDVTACQMSMVKISE